MIKLDHLTILVRDYRASRDWYLETLGLEVEFEVPGLAVALRDDAGFTLFLEQAASGAVTPSCVLYFQVDDLEAKHRLLAAARIQFIHPPQKRFWGYGAEVADPDGYRLRLWDERTMREKGDS
jgi:catechol 2,3-dioxygenase-like lactoylglutathione lyase family enzyme